MTFYVLANSCPNLLRNDRKGHGLKASHRQALKKGIYLLPLGNIHLCFFEPGV